MPTGLTYACIHRQGRARWHYLIFAHQSVYHWLLKATFSSLFLIYIYMCIW
jgi:hypothetical protein